MVDKPQTDAPPQAAVPGTPPVAGAPRRAPGQRGTDMRDSVAELAERAQLISQEAGTKVAAAMRDVISAAAGIAGFAIESARDLVQYMVKRGQMTPEEADKLIREAEEAHGKRNPGAAPHKPATPPAERSASRPTVKAVDKPPTIVPVKPAPAPAPAPPAPKAAAAAPKPATPKAAASVKKTAHAATKKTAPAKGAVKRPAVAKASAKPIRKK